MYIKKKVTRYEEKAYWRKANAIHHWFSTHSPSGELDDCEEMEVTKEMLEELLNDCKQVKANHELAKEILPTQDGFFFGSTEYDSWYFDDIDSTIEQIEKLLEETDFENDELIYYAWW